MGSIEFNGLVSLSLKTVNLRVVERKIFPIVNDNMICAAHFQDNSCSVGFNFVLAKICHKLIIRMNLF
jgi:hypothetical protein